MPSTYSQNLKIELIATGEQTGTWGNTTNTNLGTALEQSITGIGNASFASDANLTLTFTDSNSSQVARNLVLDVTSAVPLTATRDLVVPTIQKQYIVWNNTTGGQSIVVKTTAGTGITVLNGDKMHLMVDGTNVVQAVTDVVGGEIVSTGGTQTLTNKTLTSPTIGTITNTGTLTLPTSTDTLVGRATTDTLTNKTLTSPVINTPTGIVKGDVGLGNVDNTSDATKNSATATLTNKTVNLGNNTVTGTLAQFNTAVSDATLARTDAAQSFTGRQTFSGTDGIVIPVGTTAQRDGSPVIGLARLNTSIGVMEYYDGTVWRGFGEQFIEIGTPMGGGYFAGYISTSADGVPTHYLIVAPKATGENLSIRYGPTGVSDPTSFIDGPANTATLVASGDRDAADFCAAVTAGGFTDWYMPARSELNVLYWAFKPTTGANTTSNPDRLKNDFSVPKITTDVAPAGPPVQTIANQFRDGNSEAFVAGFYWSSSQGNTSLAWRQRFASGNVSFGTKTFLRRVRAVRRIAI